MGMSQRQLPRPTNASTDLRILKTYVSSETWSDVMDRAESAGLSVSRYLSALIDRDELDSDGRPLWAELMPHPKPLPGMGTTAA